MAKFSLHHIENILSNVRYTVFRKTMDQWKIPSRTISDHEFVYIVGGEGLCSIEDKTYPINKGQLYYFYPTLVHSLESCNDNHLQFYAIHFTYKIFNNITLQHLPLEPMTTITNMPLLEDYFKQINQIYTYQQIGYQWQSNLIFSNMLFYLFNQLNYKELNYSNTRRLEIILAYIKKNYNKKLTIETLCKEVDLSTSYLNQIFKSIVGSSPTTYINKFRINQSKDLLLSSSLKIGDIASKVGFNDVYYYSKLFKKLEGCSPIQYRKNMKDYL